MSTIGLFQTEVAFEKIPFTVIYSKEILKPNEKITSTFDERNFLPYSFNKIVRLFALRKIFTGEMNMYI